MYTNRHNSTGYADINGMLDVYNSTGLYILYIDYILKCRYTDSILSRSNSVTIVS